MLVSGIKEEEETLGTQSQGEGPVGTESQESQVSNRKGDKKEDTDQEIPEKEVGGEQSHAS